MKKNIKLILAIFAIASTILPACNSMDEVGYSVLPKDDKFTLEYTDTLAIDVKNVIPADTSDSYNTYYGLIGSYNDPVFGASSSEFVSEFRPLSYANFTTSNFVVDSVRLYVYLADTTSTANYGNNTSGTINFSIHELTNVLDSARVPSNTNMNGQYNSTPLVSYQYSLANDTNFFVIDLPNSFGERILAMDSLVSFADFKDKFPGFYFKLDPNQDVALTKFYMNSASTKIILYYSDSTSHSTSFVFDQYCKKFNLFKHEYAGTKIEQNITNNQSEDSIIYLQSMNGVRATINLKNASSIYGKVINEATIIVPVELDDDYLKYSPINDLILLSVDNDNQFHYISEYSNSGQLYNSTNHEYTFNITRYMQSIANQVDSLQSKLYLVSTYDKVDLRRVVLDNRNNKIKLKLKYIK
jgi:predicted small secreted protein